MSEADKQFKLFNICAKRLGSEWQMEASLLS
jgi:hypothetical protein